MNDLQQKIDNYKTSVFQLSDALYQLTVERGRKTAKEMSGLDLHKFQFFLTIGTFVNRNHNVLPEYYIEVSNLTEKQADKYLTKAVKENLTPCQLRKIIRKDLSTVIKSKKEIKVNKFGKYLQLIKTQIGYMKTDERQRAKELLKTI